MKKCLNYGSHNYAKLNTHHITFLSHFPCSCMISLLVLFFCSCHKVPWGNYMSLEGEGLIQFAVPGYSPSRQKPEAPSCTMSTVKSRRDKGMHAWEMVLAGVDQVNMGSHVNWHKTALHKGVHREAKSRQAFTKDLSMWFSFVSSWQWNCSLQAPNLHMSTFWNPAVVIESG